MIGGYSLYVTVRAWPPALSVEVGPTVPDDDGQAASAHVSDSQIEVDDFDGLYANRAPMGFAPREAR